MVLLSDIFIGLVAVLHILFMVLETFLWQTSFAKKRFQMSDQRAADTAVLAKNQGVYNLFLAGGLIFAQWFRGEPAYFSVTSYFLGCVIVAGLVGAATVNRRIFVVQAIPAIIALGLLWATQLARTTV